jgi:hypothetical protein
MAIGIVLSVEYISKWSIVATANNILYGKFRLPYQLFFNLNKYGQNLMHVAWPLMPGSMKAGLFICVFRKP